MLKTEIRDEQVDLLKFGNVPYKRYCVYVNNSLLFATLFNILFFPLLLILGDGNASGGSIGLPDFDHKNLSDWLHKRNATNAPLNTDYVSLLRKCE